MNSRIAFTAMAQRTEQLTCSPIAIASAAAVAHAIVQHCGACQLPRKRNPPAVSDKAGCDLSPLPTPPSLLPQHIYQTRPRTSSPLPSLPLPGPEVASARSLVGVCIHAPCKVSSPPLPLPSRCYPVPAHAPRAPLPHLQRPHQHAVSAPLTPAAGPERQHVAAAHHSDVQPVVAHRCLSHPTAAPLPAMPGLSSHSFICGRRRRTPPVPRSHDALSALQPPSAVAPSLSGSPQASLPLPAAVGVASRLLRSWPSSRD